MGDNVIVVGAGPVGLVTALEAPGLSFLVYATGEWITMDSGVLKGRVPHPYNFHLGQDKLASIPLAHLLRFPRTQVCFGTQVTWLDQDDGVVTVTAVSEGQTRKFHAGWVVGADGAGSLVRWKRLRCWAPPEPMDLEIR